jgi:hypothetical protein
MNRLNFEERPMQILNMQHDEAFLSLLSSQRELLNQLNMGNMLRRAEQAPAEEQIRTEGGGGGSLLAPESRGLTNMSIAERRSSMDMLFTMSKRFSMGMGYDQSQGTYPSYTGDLYQGEADGQNFDDRDAAATKYKIREEKVDAHQDEPHSHKQKRRLSSLGFISSSFFEDHLREVRRNSTDFLSQPCVDDMPNDPQDDDSVHIENNEDDEEEREQDAVSLEPFGMTEHSKCSPTEFKTTMQGFASAMEVSQKSQQAIHDWDKKMGLKRSHSKTMRLSARSRKKLRASFKKEINALSSKN